MRIQFLPWIKRRSDQCHVWGNTIPLSYIGWNCHEVITITGLLFWDGLTPVGFFRVKRLPLWLPVKYFYFVYCVHSSTCITTFFTPVLEKKKSVGKRTKRKDQPKKKMKRTNLADSIMKKVSSCNCRSVPMFPYFFSLRWLSCVPHLTIHLKRCAKNVTFSYSHTRMSEKLMLLERHIFLISLAGGFSCWHLSPKMCDISSSSF